MKDFLTREHDTKLAPPVIVAVCGPFNYDILSLSIETLNRGLVLRAPSPPTWERFELDMSKKMRKSWPGREPWPARKLFAVELVHASGWRPS